MAIANATQSQAPPPAVALTPKLNGKHTEAGFPTLTLDRLTPSKTNPRKKFDGVEFDELVASIQEHGVVQPILVRPNPALLTQKGEYVGDKYEIVCGERRFRASLKAQKLEIPAVIRELTDEQVLEIQIVENLQREGVTALEEGEGYSQLFKLLQRERPAESRQALVAEIAKKIGKSVRYVYARMKLTELIPELKKLMAEGVLPASHADEIVRFSAEVQEEFLEDDMLFEDDYHYDEDDEFENGKPKVEKKVISFRELKRTIADDYVRNLSSAPWKWDDANLVKKAGACSVCPDNSANEPGGDPKNATCRNRQCFGEKRAAFVQIQLASATHEAREQAGFVDGHKADMSAANNKKAWKQAEAVKISPKDEHNTDVPKEERKAIHFGGSYNASFAFAKAGECAYVRPAVIVEGPETGHSRTVCVEKTCKKHFKDQGYSGYSRPVTSRPTPTLAEKKKARAQKFKEEADREVAFEQLRALQAAAVEKSGLVCADDLRHIAWKMYERLWQDRKKEVLKFLGLEIRKIKGQYGTSLDCDKPVKEYLSGFTASGQILGFLFAVACFGDALHSVGPNVAYYEDKPDKEGYRAILSRLKVDSAAIDQRVRSAKDAERALLDAKDDERDRKAKEKAAAEKAAKKKLPPLVDGELQTSAKPKATVKAAGMIQVQAKGGVKGAVVVAARASGKPNAKDSSEQSRKPAGGGAKKKSASSPKPKAASGKKGGRK